MDLFPVTFEWNTQNLFQIPIVLFLYDGTVKAKERPFPGVGVQLQTPLIGTIRALPTRVKTSRACSYFATMTSRIHLRVSNKQAYVWDVKGDLSQIFKCVGSLTIKFKNRYLGIEVRAPRLWPSGGNTSPHVSTKRILRRTSHPTS